MGKQTPFSSMLNSLESLTGNPAHSKINKTEYENFCKEFVFHSLRDEHGFGEAFCNKFGFNNTFLKSLSNRTAKYHIEKLGYIEK